MIKISKSNLLSIIIVNWNTKDYISDCINSIYKNLKGHSFEVIVIDNASIDDSSSIISSNFPEVILINNKENVGFSLANNKGIEASSGDYLLFLNPDTLILNDFYDEVMNFMTNHPKIGILGLKLLWPDFTLQVSTAPNPSLLLEVLMAFRLRLILPKKMRANLFYGEFWDHSTTKKVGNVSGAAMFTRRSAINQVGAWSNNFFIYGEDKEFCYRMEKNGWEVWFLSTISIIHYGGTSTSQIWSRVDKNLRMLEGRHIILKEYFSNLGVKSFIVLMIINRIFSLLKGYILNQIKHKHNDFIDLKRKELRWLIKKF